MGCYERGGGMMIFDVRQINEYSKVVTIVGKVTKVDKLDYAFYIDEGNIRVEVDVSRLPSVGNYVIVQGVLFMDEENPVVKTSEFVEFSKFDEELFVEIINKINQYYEKINDIVRGMHPELYGEGGEINA